MTHQPNTTSLLIVSIATLSLAGCGSPIDDAEYRPWRDRDPARWQIAEGSPVHSRDTLRTEREGGDDTGTSGEPSLSTDPGPGVYVALALAHNPSIRAAERRVERLGERISQVTSLDDPMLQIAPFGEMAETAAGQVGVMSTLSQKFPFFGKLDTRGEIAEQDVAMALANLQQTRLQVAADTRRAYWSYYFTTRALETMRESRQLLSQFKQIAEAEYRAGQRSQPDVLRASVELSNLDSELITLEQRQATARSMLNQLLDRPIGSPLPEPAKAELAELSLQLDVLLASAAAENPSIRRIHERIEQFRQRRKLAQLSRKPDLTVSATYNLVDDEGMSMAANGDDQWWFGFGVNLPIWVGKYDAAEREALQGTMEGVADLTAARNRIAFEVEDAYLRVESQQKLGELFRDVIVPQARQTVDASASGYRAGSVDFLTLVDNWRKLLNFELMHHRALAEMEKAVADLEQAVGQDVVRGAMMPDAPPAQSEPNYTTPSVSAEEQM